MAQHFIDIKEVAQQDGWATHLVVTNAYPHPNALYRNGFVHRRVQAYRERGTVVDVFVLSPAYKESEHYTYEGVRVIRGNREHFQQLLMKRTFEKFLIHFVSHDMIDVIHTYAKETPLLVWIHGFEAEAWHRRWFNFLESKESLLRILNMRETYYKPQQQMMNWLSTTDELHVTFVHVSRWFKEHIAECDARATAKRSAIIPNVIADDLFQYNEKDEAQRTKILSIRPYASRKYANDLSVEAVLHLSRRPYFKQLEFAFYGEGHLFEETVRPLRRFENVKIIEGFLTQTEIAALHKEYGIFLCPTRLDAQGVSMCEAMSSGLVPLSTNTTAIPEFVTNDESGILARRENSTDLANAIELLLYSPSIFQRLSREAARSIREKCGTNVVIEKELALIKEGVVHYA